MINAIYGDYQRDNENEININVISLNAPQITPTPVGDEYINVYPFKWIKDILTAINYNGFTFANFSLKNISQIQTEKQNNTESLCDVIMCVYLNRQSVTKEYVNCTVKDVPKTNIYNHINAIFQKLSDGLAINNEICIIKNITLKLHS